MEIKTLEGLMIFMCEYYSREISKDMAELMASDYRSEGFIVGEVLNAWNQWRKRPNCVRMPTPGDLLGILKPQLNPREEAIRRLAKIKESVRKFGWPSPGKAKEYLGEIIWRDVERMGGWKHLCESPDLNLHDSIIYAQVRDGLSSSVQAERSGIDYEAKALPGAENKVLELASKLGNKMSIEGKDK